MPGGTLFNATTSKLEDTTGTDFTVSQFTICGHLYAIGPGEGNAGRVINCPEGGGASGFLFYHHADANTLGFIYAWSVTNGSWSFPATDGQYNAVALSYDNGLATNDPVARVGYASATVTELATPSVTPVVPASSGYCIGNLSAQTRTWDGGIMDLQFHPALLSAADMDKALRYPGSVRTEGAQWWPMLNAIYTEKWVVTSGVWVRSTDPTATALAGFTTASPTRMPVDAELAA